jgi:hypothetical protein
VVASGVAETGMAMCMPHTGALLDVRLYQSEQSSAAAPARCSGGGTRRADSRSAQRSIRARVQSGDIMIAASVAAA